MTQFTFIMAWLSKKIKNKSLIVLRLKMKKLCFCCCWMVLYTEPDLFYFTVKYSNNNSCIFFLIIIIIKIS